MELRTEVEIDAPPDRVWSVLSDFARYPEWNPFIVRAEGELRVGGQLHVTLSLPEGGEHPFKSTIVRCEPGEELRWRGQLWLSGLFNGEHFFKLEGREGGKTRVMHGENLGGLLVRFMGRSVTLTIRGSAYMNQALKKRVEGALR